MRCKDCLFFLKVEWVGSKAQVQCHHPFYTPDDNTDPEQGCPFGNRAHAPEKKKGAKQQKLFKFEGDTHDEDY